MTMIASTDPDKRAQVALKRLMVLNAEQESIYHSAYRLRGITVADRMRLDQIVREIALVQDERNRARCGAPPAPGDYDPFVDPPIVADQVVPGSSELQGKHCKVTPLEVAEMRRLYTEEGLTATNVWHEFPHIKESTVRDILKNRTWHDPLYNPEQKKQPCQKVRDVVRRRTRRRKLDS